MTALSPKQGHTKDTITKDKNEDSVLRRLDAEVYARVQAAAIHTLYGYIDYLARNILPDLADEDWLTRHGNIKRCPRKGATNASGFVRWEGVQNALSLPAVIAEIKAFLQREGEPGSKLFLSRLTEAISLAAGEVAHRLIAPTGDIELAQTEVPVLSEVTWAKYKE